LNGAGGGKANKKMAKSNPAPLKVKGVARGCGHKILESRDEGELGYASFESKSEIPGKI
jgi:hypothetical protein